MDNGNIDLPGTTKILDNIKTTGLAKYTGKPALPAQQYNYPAPEMVNPKMPVSVTEYKDPLQFWEILVNAMNENPPPQDQISALLPMFEPLGIELGKAWDRTQLSPEVLVAMTDAAKNLSSMLPYLPVGTFYQGVFLPPPSIGDFGTDYRTRAVIARIGLTANTPFEAVYWNYTSDADGNFLVGTNKYTMTFKEEIPYYEPGFWSVTYMMPAITTRFQILSIVYAW